MIFYPLPKKRTKRKLLIWFIASIFGRRAACMVIGHNWVGDHDNPEADTCKRCGIMDYESFWME